MTRVGPQCVSGRLKGGVRGSVVSAMHSGDLSQFPLTFRLLC
nr:MAG TPA: hypothetical protein [Caudoviricetes sp.]